MNTASSPLHRGPVRTARHYPEFSLAATVGAASCARNAEAQINHLQPDGKKIGDERV